MANQTKRRRSKTPKVRRPRKSVMDNEPILKIVDGQPVYFAIDQEGKSHRLGSLDEAEEGRKRGFVW